jgi:hypothetical protein
MMIKTRERATASRCIETMTKRGAAAGAVATVAAVLLLAGCGMQSDQTSAGLQPVGAAANCSAGSRQLVASFIASFNSGDALQLDRLFAGPGHGLFEWYSTDAPGERINDVAKDRSSLMAYFAKRHSHHERLELRYFHFIGNQGTLGGFEFELIRSADDGLASTPYGGKGAFDCEQSPIRLVVWSMAREPFLRSDVPLYLSLIALLLITLAAGAIACYRWRRPAGMTGSSSGA